MIGGEPALLAAGRDWAGLRHALATMAPEQLLAQVKAANVRGRGGAGFPAGEKWEFARDAPGERRFIVANGDEGDPGSYIDKVLMEAHPNLLIEGMVLAGYAVGADHGFVLTRSEYPRSKPLLEAAVARARREGILGASVLGSGVRVRHHDRRRRGLLRRRRGDGAARLPAGVARDGLRAAAVSRPARPARAADRRQQRRDALQHPARRARRRGRLPRAEPGRPTAGTKLVCFNERFARPGVYEVRFGTTMRELCEDVAGGLVDGHAIKALQIGGPLGGILPGWKLDTRV